MLLGCLVSNLVSSPLQLGEIPGLLTVLVTVHTFPTSIANKNADLLSCLEPEGPLGPKAAYKIACHDRTVLTLSLTLFFWGLVG